MVKKASPAKTHTGNTLAQFVILSALTAVTYQFIATRFLAQNTTVETANDVSGVSHPIAMPSPAPWTDPELAKYRPKHRNSRDAVSTTEFSCFMACVGLFGLMQRKKKRRLEEAAVEAQERLVLGMAVRGEGDKCHEQSHLENSGGLASAISISSSGVMTASPDLMATLCTDIHTDLLSFLSADDLVVCSMVNKSWHEAVGDSSDELWRTVFARDFGESGERFTGILPHICWRQYYFLHLTSRTVELARWLDHAEQRKCVVIEGHVYDVTPFLDSHPGGFHVIADVLGTDATELWDQFQHSMEAKVLMQDYIVYDPVVDALTKRAQRRNLAVVERRWRLLSWFLAHAHLFGNMSSSFLHFGFKFVVWKTAPKMRLKKH